MAWAEKVVCVCVYLCYLTSLIVNIHNYETIIMSIERYASVSTSVRWGQE